MSNQPSSHEHGDAGELSRALAALADPCRRRVVAVLSERRADIPMSTLVTLLLAVEDGFPPASAESARAATADADSLAIALHHVHLPKLSDVGFVEYDPGRRTVSPGRRIDEGSATDRWMLVEALDGRTTDAELRLFSTDAARATLAVFVDAAEVELDVSTVAERLAARIGGQREAHAIRLRHNLLPKLADAGVVDYDAARATVSCRSDSPLLDASFSPAPS
ncbi:DUF7344 domain-containing protein [Haloprofundus halobius]|uniref:DUF7344 domain-containing protein n=1 Tax=Haloprofundus halobius TaxID=2876194 RepID=UPI001CCD4F2D|nr:hypothetical protein [Haloprofundus halobius]